MEMAARRVLSLGKGTLLTKLDLKSVTGWSLSIIMTGTY